MALPASWNTKRVFGTWLNYDGTRKAGTYEVRIPTRVTNTPQDVILPAGIFASGILANAGATSGTSFDLQLPITDDADNSPANWQLTITIKFTGTDPSATEVYQIPIPAAAPSEINLRTVVIPTLVADPLPVLFRGVPGGVAGLDSDGDVIDSDGVKVIAGGGGGGGPITADQITDSGTAGRAVVVSELQADVRAASGAAADSAVVKLTGAQTVAGVKTFSSAPAVPDNSFAESKVTNLTSDLAARALSSSLATVATTGDAADLGSLLNAVVDVVTGQVARVALCVMVGYDDTGAAWPTVPSALLTDPNVGLHWLGGTVSTTPPTSSGPGAWDYPA